MMQWLKSGNLHKAGLAAIVAVYLLYAGLFIWRTSVVVQVAEGVSERYFVLFDDAMISMRYARNLAQGYGLVWNPGGERVEGYTNPLWVLWMAGIHLLPVPEAQISLVVQISGLVFLTLNLLCVDRLARLISGVPWVGLAAAALTAFYYPLNVWSLEGMETSLQTLVITLALWMTVTGLRKGGVSPWLYLLLGVGTLLRMDMAVPLVLIVGFLALVDRQHRWRHVAWGLAMLALFVGGQTLLRYLYYGDLLPNTYYLKMSGYPAVLRILRGAYIFLLFAGRLNWVLLLLPVAILLVRRSRETALLALIFAGQIAYSIYVGGDAWEHQGGANRYIAVAIPAFFILFADALEQIRAGANQVFASVHRIQVVTAGSMAVFLVSSFFNFNALLGPESWERLILKKSPLFSASAQEYLRQSMTMLQITTEDATLATIPAGALPYFTDRYWIDLFGKCERHIARVEVRIGRDIRNISNFRPGHVKWDYEYVLEEYKPDVILHVYGDMTDIQPILDAEYIYVEVNTDSFYVRRDSPYILWDAISLDASEP